MDENVDASDETLAAAQQELRNMWQTTPLNRYYLPISRLPPLGPDPRQQLGRKAPSCCPDRNTSRVDRIARRWNSLPQLRSELPAEALDEIQAWEGMAGPSPSQRQDFLEGNTAPARAASTVRAPCDCRSKMARKYLGARHKHGPHIRCTCCEHPAPKPRLQRITLGEAATALIAEAMKPS